MQVDNSGRVSAASSEKSEKSPKRTIAGKTVESWEDVADNSISTGMMPRLKIKHYCNSVRLKL